MKKINWKKTKDDPKDREAIVSGILLHCWHTNGRWNSHISIRGVFRSGRSFCSIDKAKDDCVVLAKQMLVDHYAGVSVAMKHFDIDCDVL